MAHKRIYCLDYGRGLAIFGMLLAHTFEAGICNWEDAVELDYINRIPKWVIVCVSPIALICMMGLFFTFITTMACTMSIVNIEKHGKGAVMVYLFYRLVFGIVLKTLELILKTWWDEFGFFDRMKIELPVTEVTTFSHTLDSIAFCGFLVPLTVYVFRILPYFRESWKRQVTGMTCFSSILLMFSNYVAIFTCWIGDWALKYRFNLLMTLMYKIGTGSFMISQAYPIGVVGGCLSLILLNTSSWKALRIYSGVIAGIAVVVTIFFFIVTPDPFKEVLNERKPCFMRFLELGVETFITVWLSSYSDNPDYPVIKRYKYNRATTFLRRLGCVSLTCFIFEEWVSKQLRKVFFIFFGNPYDAETSKSLWNFWVVGAFMIINFVIDLLIVDVWGKVNFVFSCERLIGAIMSWLFGRTEKVDWKANNDKIIYGPLRANEEEIMTKGTEKDREELKKIIGDKKFEKLVAEHVEAGVMETPAPPGDQSVQEVEMTSVTEKNTVTV